MVNLCLNISAMIKTGNPIISIYTEMTPNPETMKFVANKLLYPGKSIDFPDIETAKPSPLALEEGTWLASFWSGASDTRPKRIMKTKNGSCTCRR